MCLCTDPENTKTSKSLKIIFLNKYDHYSQSIKKLAMLQCMRISSLPQVNYTLIKYFPGFNILCIF